MGQGKAWWPFPLPFPGDIVLHFGEGKFTQDLAFGSLDPGFGQGQSSH